MSRLRSIAFALATLGLVSSTLVHFASWFAVVPMGSVWPLHVGVIALGFALVATASARRRGRFFGPSVRELLEGAPRWGERALALVFLNFLGQFGGLLLATRTSLYADRPAPPGYEIRMFSALWMTAYLFFALVWWRRAADPRATPSR